jgi:3-oxoacyl-[acyl-carrier protein] reductase
MRTFPLSDIPPVDVRYPGLTGKKALVSGGERGIGQGIAAFLARQGMDVLIVGVSKEEGVAAEVVFKDAGLPVSFFAADLSSKAEVDDALAVASEKLGRIDLLVNNAVRNHIIDFLEYEDDTWERVFEGNLRIVYYLTQEIARKMAESGGGNIISISSVGGLRAHRRSVAYDATKGAVDAMTRALALDLAPHDIRVNAVAPGAIVNRPEDEARAKVNEERASGIPLARVGHVNDVATLVGFLASDLASYITGQTICVDGGLATQLTPPGIYI